MDCLSAHINAGLKECERDVSGTKQDFYFKITEDLAEDAQTQSLALQGKCSRTCSWFA